MYDLARKVAKKYWLSGRGRKIGSLDDVVSEAIIIALELCARYSADNLPGYLTRSIVHGLNKRERSISSPLPLTTDIPQRESFDIESLLEAVSQLHESARNHINMRYGLTGEPPVTLVELAKRLDVSVTAMIYREHRILAKLRRCME